MSTESTKYLLRYGRGYSNHPFFAPSYSGTEQCQIEFEAKDDDAAAEYAVQLWGEITTAQFIRTRGPFSVYTGEYTFISVSQYSERKLFFDVEEEILRRMRRRKR